MAKGEHNTTREHVREQVLRKMSVNAFGLLKTEVVMMWIKIIFIQRVHCCHKLRRADESHNRYTKAGSSITCRQVLSTRRNRNCHLRDHLSTKNREGKRLM